MAGFLSFSPYFAPTGDPLTSIWPSASAQGGDPIEYADTGALNDGVNYYYIVKAVSLAGRAAEGEGEVGAFSFPLMPGE